MTIVVSGVPARPVQSFDPTAGHVWRRFEPAPDEDVRAAVHAAREAQRAWREVPLRRRARHAQDVRRLVYERRDALAELLAHETGKPSVEALFEVLLVADTAAWAARSAPRVLRSRRFRSRQIATLRKTIEVRWEPFGVVGIVSPWNYPLLLPAGTLLPSLVAGNAVVLKPSEFTPSCGEALVELVREAGLPHDLVHCVQGDGNVGRTLIESGIDRLFFTGSEGTGRKVAALAGEHLVPCSLELGGSDPAIVLDDADPVVAARGIVWARCANAGQTCVAAKRVFVQRGIHDRFVAELAREVSALHVGSESGRDVGPLIRAHQAETLRAQRAEALARGARVLAHADPRVPSPAATSVEVLVDVDERMRVMREETFGPLLPVVPFDTVEEAIEAANRSPFGLSASIWTRDARRGAELAGRLEAGTVMVNDVLTEAAMPEVAHGGTKASGGGRLHGDLGLMEVAWPKTVVVDSFAGWPQVWWFPYTERLREGLAAFFVLLHGRGPLARLRAGLRAVRLLFVRPGL